MKNHYWFVTLLFLVLSLALTSCDELLSNEEEELPPDAPRQLVVQIASNGSIEMGWIDQSDNELGFRLEYQIAGSIVWTTIAEVGRNATSYSWSNPEENTTYSFRIYAYNDVDDSDYSYSTSLYYPLYTPTNLTATINGTVIDLNWQDNSQSESGYRIERNDNGSGFNEIATTNASVNYYEDSGFPSGASLVYRVVAVSGTSESGASNEASVTAPQLLNAPSNLTANLSGGAVSLGWEDNSSIETGFRIIRKDGTADFTQIGVVGSNVTSYNDDGFPYDTPLVYRVVAFDADGNVSNPSNDAQITVPSPETLVYEDDFESYSAGYWIDDPWNWGATSTDYVVFFTTDSNPIPSGGSNSLAFYDDSEYYYGNADLEFSGITAGRIEFDLYVYYYSASPYLAFGMALSLDEVWATTSDFGPYVYWSSDGYFYATDGTNFGSYVVFPTSEWYHVTLEFDVSNSTYSVMFDDSVIGENLSFYQNQSGSSAVAFSILMYESTMLYWAQLDNFKLYSYDGTGSTSGLTTASKRGPIYIPTPVK